MVAVPSARAREWDGLGAAALGVLAFSFSIPMTKIAVRGIDPLLASTGRAAVAGLLGVAVLARRRPARPDAAQLRGLVVVVAGVVLGFPLLTAFAVRHVPSAHGAVVTGLLPLATAGFATLRAGERPGVGYWAASALGVVAIAWFALAEGGGSLHVADLLLAGAVLAAGLGYTDGAVLARTLGGSQVICQALVLALPCSLVATVALALADPPHATVGQWAAFGYTAAVSMFLGFFAWYAGLARAGIARGGQLQLAQPLLSVLWGWVLLGETPTARVAVAAALVLVAVTVGRRAPVRGIVRT